MERRVALELTGQPLVLRPHVGPHDVEVLHAFAQDSRHRAMRSAGTPEGSASRAGGSCVEPVDGHVDQAVEQARTLARAVRILRVDGVVLRSEQPGERVEPRPPGG